MALCPHCGNEISDNAKFCPKCGQSVDTAPTQGQPNQQAQFQGQPDPGAGFQGQPNQGQQFQGQQFQGQPYPGQAPYPMAPTISSTYILKRAFGVILQKPIRLWALSLLVTFLSALATILGGPVPIIGIAVGLVLEFGMAYVYLEGYRGREVKVDQIFEGFHNFWPTLASMGWKQIIQFLWFFAPFMLGAGIAGALASSVMGSFFTMLLNSFDFYGGSFDMDYSGMGAYAAVLGLAGFVFFAGLIVGCVLTCIKSYAYMFVPYIIREDSNRRATDVARESDARTKGFKGKIFLTDFLIVLIVLGFNVVVGILGIIPYVGGFFSFVGSIVNIIVGLFTPLLCGLVHAAWYEEITKIKGTPMV